MARSRRKFRPIVVDGVRFHWRVSTDRHHGFDPFPPLLRVEVVGESAFVPGQRGQTLTIMIELPFLLVPLRYAGVGIEVFDISVTPRAIAQAIRIARVAEPPFTGEVGIPDIALPMAKTRELFGLSPAETLERIADRAARLLALPQVDGFMGCLLVLATNAAPELHALIEREAPRVDARRDEFQAYAVRLAQSLGAPQYGDGESAPASVGHGERCAQRSAIAFFNEVGGPRLGWTIDASDADAIFAKMPDADTPSVPKGIPGHHMWYRKQPRSVGAASAR